MLLEECELKEKVAMVVDWVNVESLLLNEYGLKEGIQLKHQVVQTKLYALHNHKTNLLTVFVYLLLCLQKICILCQDRIFADSAVTIVNPRQVNTKFLYSIECLKVVSGRDDHNDKKVNNVGQQLQFDVKLMSLLPLVLQYFLQNADQLFL